MDASTRPVSGSHGGPLGKPRSPGLVILLTIVTFGIWTIVWSYQNGEELKQRTGQGLGGVAYLFITLLISPVLVPETVLAVGLLLFLRWLSVPRSFALLLLGNTMIALPFVVLVVQAVIHIVAIVPAWTKSGWTIWRRVHFTLFGLAFAFAAWLLWRTGAVGASFYG